MGFFQMNKAYWPEVEVMMNRECPRALDVWWHLAPLTNRLGVVAISQQDIMTMIGVKSRTTVNHALNYMEKKGLLIKGKKGVQNIYILNWNLIKQTRKDTTKNALKPYGIVFPANVVITKKNERSFYDKFKKLIQNNHTGYINLNHVKFGDKANNGGKATKNGEKIKHRNGATKERVAKDRKLRDEKEIKRGWSFNKKRAKRLHIAYQTRITFPKSKQNKKSVKN